MLFSFLIASVSTGPTSTTSIEPDATSVSPTPINITNGCGVYGFYGAVDHAFLVTLKPAVNSDGSLLNTTEDKLSFLQGWVDQYTADQLDYVRHFFTETQFAVAVDASDETIARMAEDPAVYSIEVDCYVRLYEKLLSPPSPMLPPSPPPSPQPKSQCEVPMDFVLVLDESGSMKKPKPHGSMDGDGGLKALAKELVGHYALGKHAVRFSVVSFAVDATTRVGWSYDAAEINAGIDQMSADGKTSISDGINAAGLLLYTSGRKHATKVMLIVSDGEQTIDALPGKTPKQTAVYAAVAWKKKLTGVRVFSWGFGTRVSLATLQQMATYKSKPWAILAKDVADLKSSLALLKAALCYVSFDV